MSDKTKVRENVLEFDFKDEDIFLKPDEFRRIRKLMQIAQKNLYLVFEYAQDKDMYKVRGIVKQENVNKLLCEEDGTEKVVVPFAKAEIKQHMHWEFRLGEQYIFSCVNGNYKISARMTEEYLQEKCEQIFGEGENYGDVIEHVIKSSEQSHGTMIVVLSDEVVNYEVKKFTDGKFGMNNPGKSREDSVMDINSFNSIDGSVVMDQHGKIHAIGVILDGAIIQNGGNMARGSRYNSAVKYRDYLRNGGKNGMILIVSEDGSVEP